MTDSGIPVDGERIDAADVMSSAATMFISGMILYWKNSVATIPTGFVESTAVRGRTIVGVPSGGTVAGTVGSALTNLQDITHTHTGPSHAHELPFAIGGTLIFGAAFGSGAAFTGTNTAALSSASNSPNSMLSNTGGTGNTGANSAAAHLPYIQYPAIEKS